MSSIALLIDDPVRRITLEMMLRNAGHVIAAAGGDADLAVADTPERAVEACRERPALLLAEQGRLAGAVEAMRAGVFGYIFIPFVPGEAELMVARALAWAGRGREGSGVGEMPLSQVERQHIERVLRGCRGNQAEAARLLGIGRNTLWRKLRMYREENNRRERNRRTTDNG